MPLVDAKALMRLFPSRKEETEEMKGLKKFCKVTALLICLVLLGGSILVCMPAVVNADTGTVYSEYSQAVVPVNATSARKWRTYFTWTATETADSVKIGVKAYIQLTGGACTIPAGPVKLTATGQTAASATKGFSYDNGSGATKINVINKTYIYKKTMSAQTKTVTCTYTVPSGRWAATRSAAKKFTIPALSEATLSYNANGGSGEPTSETLTKTTATSAVSFVVSNKRPKLDGYIFRGWATDSAATEAEFQPGDKISIVENTILYALWERGIAVEGNIIWDDGNDADGIRPEKLYLKLIDGEGNFLKEVSVSSLETFYIFEGLSEDEYTVELGDGNGYGIKGYTVLQNGFDLVLKHEPQTVTIAGSVIWNDDSDSYGDRPSSCRVLLYRDDCNCVENKVGEYAIDTSNDEDLYSFTVNKNEKGALIDYIIVPEKGFNGYVIGRDGNNIIYNIRHAMKNMDHAFAGCESLPAALDITYNVENVACAFEGCEALSGKAKVDANPRALTGCYKGTVLPIAIIGRCSEDTCNNLIGSASHGNVECSHKGHGNFVISEEDNARRELIQEGDLYFDKSENEILKGGDAFPQLGEGDLYLSGDYVYGYGVKYTGKEGLTEEDVEGTGEETIESATEETREEKNNEDSWNGTSYWNKDSCKWSARLISSEKSNPKALKEEIHGEKLTSLYSTFAGTEIQIAPRIPKGVTDMSRAFEDCHMLTYATAIPVNVELLDRAFAGCSGLVGKIEVRSRKIKSWDKCFWKTTGEIMLEGAPAPEILRKLAETGSGNVLY